MKNKNYFKVFLVAAATSMFFFQSCTEEDVVTVNEINTNRNSEVEKTLIAYEIVEIDVNHFLEIANQRSESYVDVDFQIASHPNWVFSMNYMDIQAAVEGGESKAYSVGANYTVTEVDVPEQLGLKSVIDGDGQMTYVSVNEDYLQANITDGTENYRIEPLYYYDQKAKDNQYVIYNVRDLKPSNYSFENDVISLDDENDERTSEINTKSSNLASGRYPGPRYNAVLTMVADYQFYQKFNHFRRTHNYIINCWWDAAVITYGFYNGVTNIKLHRGPHVVIFDFPGSSNYKPNHSQAIPFLGQCMWFYNLPWFERRSVHYFFTGDTVYYDGNPVGGLAKFKTVCKEPNQSFSFGTYQPSNYEGSKILAHETGHSFGAPHDLRPNLNCGVMGGGGTLRFSGLSRDQVCNHVTNYHDCLWE